MKFLVLLKFVQVQACLWIVGFTNCRKLRGIWLKLRPWTPKTPWDSESSCTWHSCGPDYRVSGRNMLERWAGPLAKWFSSWRIPWIGRVGPAVLIHTLCCATAHWVSLCIHTLLFDATCYFMGMPAWMCSLQPRRVTTLRHIKTTILYGDSVEWFEGVEDHFTTGEYWRCKKYTYAIFT